MRTRITSRSVVAAAMAALLVGLGAAGSAAAAAPSNDEPAGAIAIASLPADLTTDLTEATAGAQDPAACRGDPAGMVSVWYRLDLTYPTDRWVGVSASSLDTATTRVQVVGTPGGAPTTSCYTNDGWFLAKAGHAYWVVVLALVPSGDPGPNVIALHATVATAPPANDRASHATVVSSFPFHDDVDMAGALHSANDPKSCHGPGIEQGVSPAQTIWYRLDYPYAHPHRVGVRVQGPYNNGFWVVSSPGGHRITCADNPTGDRASAYFDARPGHSYWIVVGKGDQGHSVSEPTSITIRATRVDSEDSTPSTIPPNTSTVGEALAEGSGSGPGHPSQGPLFPEIPLLAGAIAFALAFRGIGRRDRPRYRPRA